MYIYAQGKRDLQMRKTTERCCTERKKPSHLTPGAVTADARGCRASFPWLSDPPSRRRAGRFRASVPTCPPARLGETLPNKPQNGDAAPASGPLPQPPIRCSQRLKAGPVTGGEK